MANGFDVMPVRTNDESCIVVCVVDRTKTRRTIVFTTCLQGCSIERVDLVATLCGERQVETRGPLFRLEANAQR